MNIGGGEAADQMVRMMLSGGEVTVRLTGSAAKNLLAISLALAKSHRKVSGRMRMGKMLQQTRDLRTFPMTQEEYRAFKKGAREKKLLYAAVKNTRNQNGMVDVVMPPSEVERANLVFAQMMYRQPEAERQKAQEVPAKEKQPETPKKDSRSGRGSRDTSISSPTHAESAVRTMGERPSVEGRLKAYRAQLDGQRRGAPARQKTKSRKRAKAR